MKKIALPKPPDYLSKSAKGWWHRLNEEFDFDPHHLLILEGALQAFDRWTEAKALVDKEGLTLKDRFDQVKPHPASVIERDSRYAMIRALKGLGLDIQPPAGESIS